jgi:glycosyltransferase involved in cell wall biosynthesis
VPGLQRAISDGAGGMSLRVLFGTYPWAFETPGGGEIQLRKYAQHLPSHGIDVRLHDPWQRNFAGVSVFHFFSCLSGSVHFCSYIRKCGLPLVISSSLWIDDLTRHGYPIDEIRAQLSLADVVVTNSEMESEQLSRILELPRDRFVAVFNGFEPRFAVADPRPFREKFGVHGAFVLNVANIEPRKNQLGLVRALAGTGLPLVLIGSPRDRSYADQILAEGGSQVRFLGALEHEDPLLASAYAACAAFALPSLLETPGLAALEAAVSGAAVVITSEGSTREYFAEHAHYVDHNDPADIRRGIERAIAEGPDPSLRPYIMSRFAWNSATEGLVRVYHMAQERLAEQGS